ncbi:MAG: hypothetical protein ACKN92_08905, partial [Candidatus Nanopelagicaceae bacterium]
MRRLLIKFSNQIRISGWDFGSSARAMNQAGGLISTQAEGAKSVPLTFERKIMSTKTSIKRIALVAVAALGFGMVSTVSANAADAYTALVASVGDATKSTAVGTAVSTTASITTDATAASATDDVV